MIKTKVFTVIISFLLLAAIATGCGGSSSPLIMRNAVSETLLTNLDYELPHHIWYSPDIRRVAWVVDKDGKKYVVVNGASVGRGYDAIGNYFADTISTFNSDPFSPDSKHIAYIGIDKKSEGYKYYVVIDGEEQGGPYNQVTTIVFSPDSLHVAYVAGGMAFLDREGVALQGIVQSAPLFSPDSQHLAYIIARSGSGNSVVLDGVPGSFFSKLDTMVFSPDSQHLAYRAMTTASHWVIIVDGKEGNEYYDEWRFGDLKFSPDGQHFAYIAGDEHQQFIVLDGKEQARHAPNLRVLVFSPDGRRLAYGGNGIVGVDGVERKVETILSIQSLVFSPDSTHYAYIDFGKSFSYLFTNRFSSGWVVADGVKGKKYRDVGSISFSPDSKHVAYNASEGKQELVVIDGTGGKEYDRVSSVVWDSVDRFHYIAWKGNSVYLVEETIP